MSVRLTEVLESLIATGDLLEPGQVTYAEELPKGWLFPAPPSFAMLSEGVAQLFGVANEEELEGLPALRGRVVHEGASRRVTALSGEALEATLRVAGLRELSVQAWLREPVGQSATNFLSAAKKRLKATEPVDAVIDGLEIFDSAGDGIYSACWGVPGSKSGLFIARRPKAYGNWQWMLAELNGGRVVQSALLPSPGSSFRGCDEAWTTQLALDAVRGRPQRFRVRQDSSAVYLDILFPVPLWAHRRLLVLGQQVTRQKSICSFQVPAELLGEASGFLEQRLWLKRTS